MEEDEEMKFNVGAEGGKTEDSGSAGDPQESCGSFTLPMMEEQGETIISLTLSKEKLKTPSEEKSRNSPDGSECSKRNSGNKCDLKVIEI